MQRTIEKTIGLNTMFENFYVSYDLGNQASSLNLY